LVIEFILKLKKDEASEKTINNYLVLIKGVFNYGKKIGLMSENPAEGIDKLTVKHKEMHFLEPKEIVKMLDKAKQFYPDFHAMLFTAVFTGMRKGELLALTWDCVDFKENTAYVNKSIFGGKLQDPKTKASIRKIKLSDELVETLQNHKEEQKKQLKKNKKRNMGNIVFCNENGKHLDPDNFIDRRFKPVLGKAKFKKHIRWHDLRHTFASLLISKNFPPKYIQHQMGHSSIQITMDRYGHLLPEVNQSAKNAIDNLFLIEKNTTLKTIAN